MNNKNLEGPDTHFSENDNSQDQETILEKNGRILENLSEKYPKMKYFIIACIAIGGLTGKVQTANAEDSSAFIASRNELVESENIQDLQKATFFNEKVKLGREMMSQDNLDIPLNNLFSKVTTFESINGILNVSEDVDGNIPTSSKGLKIVFSEKDVFTYHRLGENVNIYEANYDSFYAIDLEKTHEGTIHKVDGFGNTLDEAILNAIGQKIIENYNFEAVDDSSDVDLSNTEYLHAAANVSDGNIFISYNLIKSDIQEHDNSTVYRVTLEVTI